MVLAYYLSATHTDARECARVSLCGDNSSTTRAPLEERSSIRLDRLPLSAPNPHSEFARNNKRPRRQIALRASHVYRANRNKLAFKLAALLNDRHVRECCGRKRRGFFSLSLSLSLFLSLVRSPSAEMKPTSEPKRAETGFYQARQLTRARQPVCSPLRLDKDRRSREKRARARTQQVGGSLIRGASDIPTR